MDIQEVSKEIVRRGAIRDRMKEERTVLAKDMENRKTSIAQIDEAVVCVQEAATRTQSALEARIASIGTQMLQIVFEDPYELSVKFVSRAGRIETDITLTQNGETLDPLTASGGGIVDIVSFSLRVSLWMIQNPKTRNTFILDEPFRFVSLGYLPRLADALKEISRQLGIQFIIVTHAEAIAAKADRTFTVSKSEGVSSVSVV